jgi:CelD/BcsL family acetyltransferase involved in cellulose biosynthesis
VARRFLKQGWLRLIFLLDADRPIAVIYCFAYNKQYFFYQSGRDLRYEKFRVGFVLMNIAIQRAIKEKMDLFDFLTGEEDYKFRWADDIRHSRHLFGGNKFYTLLYSTISKIPVKILKNSLGVTT